MKEIEIALSSQLPVPQDEVNDLISQYGRILGPRLSEIDSHFKGMDCSADGKLLLGFGDKSLLLWDTEESEPFARTELPGTITRAAVQDSGSAAIVGTESGEVFVLELPSFEVLLHRREAASIFDVHISGSDVGVFCDVEGRVVAFDYVKGEDLPPVPSTGNPGRVWLTNDSEGLIVDDENEIILYHPKTKWIEKIFSYAQSEDEQHGVGPGGWLVGKRRYGIFIWNRSSSAHAAVLDHSSRVAAFDMTRDMGTIATITDNETIHLHSPRVGQNQTREISASTYVRDPHTIKLRGDTIYIAGQERSMPSFTRDNKPKRTYFDRLIPIVSTAVSTDNRWITVGDQAGGITVYDAKEGTPVFDRLDGSANGSVSAIDADQENKLIVAGSHDHTFRVVDYSNALNVNQFKFSDAPVQAIRLVGSHAYIGDCRGNVAKADLGSGAIVQSFFGHSGRVRSIELFQDKLISIDQSGVICVFDADTEHLLHRFHVAAPAYGACLDARRGYLYAGSNDGNLHCWEIQSGRLLGRYALNRSVPRSLTICGERLVSMGLRGDLRVFDLEKQEQTLAVAIDSSAWQRWGCMNVSGTRIMSCGSDGIMRFFCSDSGVELAQGMHMPSGFLWIGGDQGVAEPDWFWTDRTDLVEVVARQGEAVDLLAADDEESQALLLERNSKRTMATVGFFPKTEIRQPTPDSLAHQIPIRRLRGPTS